MKWYMNEKLISLLQYYANNFPVHSQLKELNHLSLNMDPLPVADLFADHVEHEGFWQKIINFFKGANRAEMIQFDKSTELNKAELSDLEDEMMRILHAGMKHKEEKLLKMRSGMKSSGDSQLFAMKLIEYILLESINKARSERARIEIYERLIHLIKKMIVDFSNRYFNGWLIQILELSIEKLDEMIEFEDSQKNLRAFQDSVNEIRLGSFVRKLNEDLMASLLPMALDEDLYYEGTKVNLAASSYDSFVKGAKYNNVSKSARSILKDKMQYNLVRDGWLKNAYNVRRFQSRQDEKYLHLMSRQGPNREDIVRAITERADKSVNVDKINKLADKYEAVFSDLNRLYILSGLLSLIKKQATYLGQSATILYENEVREWFKQALDTFDMIKYDLAELTACNKAVMPYLNRQSGRGLFITSDLNKTIETVRKQIHLAKGYMHVNRNRLKSDHNEFLRLIDIGMGCLDENKGDPISLGDIAKDSENRYGLFKGSDTKRMQPTSALKSRQGERADPASMRL